MKKNTPELKTSKEFTDDEIKNIIDGLFNFLNEKQDNIFVDDFLILESKLLYSDIEILKQINLVFKAGFDNAMKIEKTKLKKFAAADRLNASFVKEILNRDHPQQYGQ